MKLAALKQMIHEAHNPKLVEEAYVTKVWEDGEITQEKGGELYGARTLHCLAMGFADGIPVEMMPKQNTKHGFAIVTSADAEKIREEIGTMDWYE